MALDVYLSEDIARQIAGGLVLIAAWNDPVLVAGALQAYRQQALAFGVSWTSVLSEVAASLPTQNASWLKGIEQGGIVAIEAGGEV